MLKIKVVGEEYFPLGHTQFNSVINKIKLTKPDVIYAIIVGGSNVAFYKQLKAAGIDLSKQTLLTISVTEDEIDGIGGENIVGAYACMKYFQSLDNANNKGSSPPSTRCGATRPSSATSRRLPISGRGCGSSPSRRPAPSTSTRSRRRRPASSSRARRKATCASTRTITSGARPASAAREADGQYDLIYETADLVEPDPFPKGYQ